MGLEAKRVTDILEAENSRESRAQLALKPVFDLDEFPAKPALFRLYIAQVASNRVLEDGRQEPLLAFDEVISPDQVGILCGHQQPRVE